jgi:hypothetical protein
MRPLQLGAFAALTFGGRASANLRIHGPMFSEISSEKTTAGVNLIVEGVTKRIRSGGRSTGLNSGHG